jgi:hypothetical protein
MQSTYQKVKQKTVRLPSVQKEDDDYEQIEKEEENGEIIKEEPTTQPQFGKILKKKVETYYYAS